MQAVSWGNSPALFSRQAFVSANPIVSTVSPQRGINTDFKSGVQNVGKSLRFAGNGQVTILSWNVKGQRMAINADGTIKKDTRSFKARLKMLERIIEEYNPEILGFQECPYNLLRAFQEELGEKYPHIFYGEPDGLMRIQVGMLVRNDVEVLSMDSPKLRKGARGVLHGKFQLDPQYVTEVELVHLLSLLQSEEPEKAQQMWDKKVQEARKAAELLESSEGSYILGDMNIIDNSDGDRVVGALEESGLTEAKQDQATYRHLEGRYDDARFDRAVGPLGTTVEVVGDFNDPVVRAAGVDHLPIICVGPARAIQEQAQRAVAFGSSKRRMDFVA